MDNSSGPRFDENAQAAWINAISDLDLDALKSLVSQYAHLDVNLSMTDDFTRPCTALACAVSFGDLDFIRLLCASGADPAPIAACTGLVRHSVLFTAIDSPSYHNRSDIIGYLIESFPYLLRVVDRHGMAPLAYATIKNREPVVKLLCQLKAPTDYRCPKTGDTLLDIGVKSRPFVGDGNTQLTMIQHLIEHDAATFQVALKYSRSALLYASELGHLEMVKHLCHHGIDVNQGGDMSTHALYLACEHGHLLVVDYLINCVASIELNRLCGIFKRTPLLCAAYHGHLSIFQMLWRKEGLDHQCVDAYQSMNALHIAVWQGHLPLLRWLYAEIQKTDAQTLDLSALDKHGRNLLQIAVDCSTERVDDHRLEMIRYLLSMQEFSITDPGDYQSSPLELATSQSIKDLLTAELKKQSSNLALF